MKILSDEVCDTKLEVCVHRADVFFKGNESAHRRFS